MRVIRYNEARTVRVGKATLSLIDTESHLNLSYVGDSRLPLDLEFTIHGLVLKDSLISCWSFLVLAFVP